MIVCNIWFGRTGPIDPDANHVVIDPLAQL